MRAPALIVAGWFVVAGCVAPPPEETTAESESELTSTLPLDTTFAASGVVFGDYRANTVGLHAAREQRVAVSSSGDVFYRMDRNVVRYSPTGTPLTTLPIPVEPTMVASYRAFALLGTDRFVVAGHAFQGARGLAVRIFSRDTPLAPGAPVDGFVEPWTGDLRTFPAIARTAPDGSVFVVGTSCAAATHGCWPYVVHVRADGSRDFAIEGGPTAREMVVRDFAIQPDGKLVLAGDHGPSSPDRWKSFVVERRMPDGSTDPTFGGQGRTLVDLPAASVGSVTVDAGGRLVVAGSIPHGFDPRGSRDPVVVRLTPDGALDPAFGAGKGHVVVPVASAAEIDARNDGLGSAHFGGVFSVGNTIVAVGTVQTNITGVRRRSAVVAVRLTADGTLDATLGADAIAFGQVERAFALSSAVLAAPKSLFVTGVVGKPHRGAEPSANREALVKFRL